MTTPRHRAASDVSDDEGYFSESSFSQSQSAYSRGDDDESTFSGSSGTSDCSADSIGRMLIHLEESNPSLTELTIDCKTLDKEAAIYVEVRSNVNVNRANQHSTDCFLSNSNFYQQTRVSRSSAYTAATDRATDKSFADFFRV